MLLPREIKTRKFKVKPAPKATPMDLPFFLTTQTCTTNNFSTIELQEIHSADSKSVDIDNVFNLARNRNWAEVQELLKSEKLKTLITNARDQDNTTLLHIAVYQNQVAMVKELVRNGADINAVDNSNHTPLDVYRISISKDYAIKGYLAVYEAKCYSELQPPRPSARGDCLSFWRNLTPAKKAGIEILALGVTEGRACLCILLATDEKFFKEFFSHTVGMTTFSSITLAGLIVIAGLYLYNSHKRSHSPIIESEAKQSRRVQHFPSIDEEASNIFQ